MPRARGMPPENNGTTDDFPDSVNLRIDRRVSNIYNADNSGTNDLLEFEVLRKVLIFTECNIVCVRFRARQGRNNRHVRQVISVSSYCLLATANNDARGYHGIRFKLVAHHF